MKNNKFMAFLGGPAAASLAVAPSASSAVEEAGQADAAANFTEAQVEQIVEASNAQAAAEATTAANTRWATVMGNATAQANVALASMLLSDTAISADAILAKIDAVTPAPAAKEEKPAPAASTTGGDSTLPETNLDLGMGTDPAALAGGGSDGEDIMVAAAKSVQPFGFGMDLSAGNLVPPTGN